MNCAFSIIITNYNHVNFLPKMIDMLKAQTFQGFEIIIIDNNSVDDSKAWIDQHKSLFDHVLFNTTNLGLCKAFNQGVNLSKGKYLIDLAPDDLFTPDKLERNFNLLESEKAHLLFSDCIIKETSGNEYRHSSKYLFEYNGKGNYFCDILERHCLISPTTVSSKICYDTVGGYDESLAYEDFDYMTKASKRFDLVYDDHPLVIKQEVTNSFSSQFNKRNSPMHDSTFEICRQLKPNLDSKEEQKAWKTRVFTEMKAQIKLFNFGLVMKYVLLLT